MYLRGSKWSLNRRRRRSNPFFITVLVILIAVFFYIDRVVVPTTSPLFLPTLTPTRHPESYLVDAENFYATGKLPQAMEAYQKAIQANPNNPSIFITLARLQVLTGNYKEALSNAENALLINANNPMAHAVRGWALGFMTPPDFLQAEGSIKESLRMDPNSALTHAYYAEVLGMQHELKQGALDTLERAIQESRIARDLDPNLFEVRRVRGYIYTLTSEYQEAADEYKAAIAINENIPNLHVSLGLCHEALEDYTEAINSYQRAYTLNPTNPFPSYRMSRTYAKVGEWTLAVQHAETALKLDPANAGMNGNLGSMYYKKGQYDRAIQYLRLAIRGGNTPDGLEVEGIPLDNSLRTLEFYNRYGLALARMNECNDAVQVAQLLIQGIPNDPDTVYNAQEMIRICQENLLATPTSLPDLLLTPQVTNTPTP
jgi:tetratricopeptide (TPR) repeat protein